MSSSEIVDLGEFFLAKILQKGTQVPTEVYFLCINKYMWEMVIMNDLEQTMLLYYVVYLEKFRKVMQRTEKEALNNNILCIQDNILALTILAHVPSWHWVNHGRNQLFHPKIYSYCILALKPQHSCLYCHGSHFPAAIKCECGLRSIVKCRPDVGYVNQTRKSWVQPLNFVHVHSGYTSAYKERQLSYSCMSTKHVYKFHCIVNLHKVLSVSPQHVTFQFTVE